MIINTKRHLNKKDYKLLLRLVLLSILISIVELVGISVVVPFLTLALNPELLISNYYYATLYDFFLFDSEIFFIIALGCFLIGFYLLRAIVNVFFNYKVAKFHYGKNRDLSVELFKKYLGMRYLEYTELNSTYLIKTIVVEAENFTSLLETLMMIFSELLIFFFIVLLFFFIDFQTTLILFLFLLLIGYIIGNRIFPIIKKNGALRAESQEKFFETVKKSLSNFKLLKLDINKADAVTIFDNYCKSFERSNIISSTLNAVPRHIMEALVFSIIIGLTILILFSGDSLEKGLNIELLLIYAMGLYRLMPSINRIISGYNSALFHSASLPIMDSSKKISKEILGGLEVNFERNMRVCSVDFSYGKDVILKNVNIDFNRGEKIAFIGSSGSGKTTLVDIIVGLITPDTGSIFVDSNELNWKNIQSWRHKIGYVPQDVYLFDGTFAENVAFSKKYNTKKVLNALKRARILDLVLSKGGIDSKVGENGILMSGGQKQRIGIARALYNSPELLVFDEATSALDRDTEIQIMNEIYQIGSNITIVIISHNIDTVQKCDKIFEISNHKVIQQK